MHDFSGSSNTYFVGSLNSRLLARKFHDFFFFLCLFLFLFAGANYVTLRCKARLCLELKLSTTNYSALQSSSSGRKISNIPLKAAVAGDLFEKFLGFFARGWR